MKRIKLFLENGTIIECDAGMTIDEILGYLTKEDIKIILGYEL